VSIVVLLCALPARAQSANTVGVRGFGLVGNVTFTANETFDAVFGSNNGLIFGGGGQVLLPLNIYVEAGAWRFQREGERVFIGPNDEIFGLGIPLDVSVTPLEITGGYRITQLARRVVPYAGFGYTALRYKETSEVANDDEDVDETFSGFHIVGGVEYQVKRWLAIGGEVGWTSVADAIGNGGVSAHFNEDNLGGTSLRVKIAVGR
jgi:hypothetical protein